jgi:hypothetical protein
MVVFAGIQAVDDHDAGLVVRAYNKIDLETIEDLPVSVRWR